jgi:hypothetical protein
MDNITIDSEEVGWEGVDWMYVAVVNTVMNLRVS